MLPPSSLKGHVKESVPGILRAMVARVKKTRSPKEGEEEKGGKERGRVGQYPSPTQELTDIQKKVL